MPHLSQQAGAYRPLSATASPLESLEVEDVALPELMARARRQNAFYDDAGLTLAQFRESPTYNHCRMELFLLFRWLKALLPATGQHGEVAKAIGGQAAVWTDLTPTTGPAQVLAQAQMFGAGKRLLFELCKALEANPRPDIQDLVCRLLETGFRPGTDLDPRAITAIGRALSAVVTLNDPDAADRRREQASSKLEGWARACRFREGTPAEVAQAFLFHLGFIEPSDATDELEIRAERYGAQACNAAGLACAEVSSRRLDSSITDRQLLDGVARLRQCAARHGVAWVKGLDSFIDRYIGSSPTGGQIDRLGNLHRFGLPALEILCQRTEEPGRDPSRVRGVLEDVLRDIGRTDDPAALLLRALQRDLPRLDLRRGDMEVEDEACVRVIRDAVARSAEGLLTTCAERERLVYLEVLQVMDLLGVSYDVCGPDGPRASGLIDLSTDNLERLLKETRRQADLAINRLRESGR